MSGEARELSPICTYFFNIKVQRVLIGTTHLIYNYSYLNLVQWDSGSIDIRQRYRHVLENGKDRIVI
jgi:hypothetical protein